ncbi:MAG: hypothetical protein J6K39_01665 [Clostridia bacterium]|nr:hypothetical protein [Clostridia bacterium]
MENISKIVIELESGKRFGYVLGLALDDKLDKIGCYVVDEESEEEFLLRCEDVACVAKDFLLVENVSKLTFAAVREESVFGKPVLDEVGNFYGCVQKVEHKKRKCVKLVTDKCELLPKNVDRVGKDVVFVSFKKRKKQEVKNVFPRTETEVKVQIQENKTVPEKIVLSQNFYLGKVARESVFGYNNEKIVLKNETVTKNVFEKAKKHNKLNQLFFAIKR